MASRRFIYYFAASVDMLIARKDGRVDWLESRAPADYGFDAFLSSIDTVVWGRRTWDEFGGADKLGPFGGATRHFVLTHSPARPLDDVEFVSDAGELATRLRAEAGKDAWLMGGGGLVRSFVEAGELDEIFVHVIPVLLGEGIPMIAQGSGDLPLRLLEARTFDDGVVRLRYAVEKPT